MHGQSVGSRASFAQLLAALLAMAPPAFQLLRAADQPVLPWKNGGGTTREVAIAKHVDGTGFRWRVSVAQVASDGPFSLYPGIDRVLWLLRGKGMVLDVDGVERRLAQRFERFEFPGEARIAARLIDGPNEDLNLMVERATTRAAWWLIVLGHAEESELTHGASPVEGPCERLLLVLGGEVLVRCGTATWTLTEGDALRWNEHVESAPRLRAHTAGTEAIAFAFVPRR